ncbi:MAG: HNH endonuclease [Kangiellaceae bacterium]|nr:HNH endonuclease [Kangiellaceae bacterium]MCW8999386.1 HNH endonuclease [Kangiellaceae bacterium]MCW9015426.1 HNH endonuclease [Kangiellaceae bacterium]
MDREYYISKLSKLKLNRSGGHPSPHKVCLLLAVIDLVDAGHRNQFTLSDDLKIGFNQYFDRFKQGRDSNDIAKPFYHLNGDGFWHFKVSNPKSFKELESKKRSPSQKKINEYIEYAYLDQELYKFLQDDHERIFLREQILDNLDDLSEPFHRWLIQLGKSEATAYNYTRAICGSISKWAEDAQICDQNLIAIQSVSRIRQVAESLTNYTVFVERDSKGNSMYSRALTVYMEFLSDVSQSDVSEDIQEIIEDTTLSETQKSQLVNTRIGQGRFRTRLLKYWKGCAVTGYKNTQFLVASHIKPWRDSDNRERLSTFNGLMLLPNLDKAFDLGYITFSESGKVCLSEFIESPDSLGIRDDMFIPLMKEHQGYMAYHRDRVFKH